MARVAPVAADTPWAFFSLSGTQPGAPRWLILEGDPPRATVGVEAVTDRLRVNLRYDPPNIAFDENCERWMDTFLTAAARAETQLLPRRMQRALDQMAKMTRVWGDQALRRGDQDGAELWWRLDTGRLRATWLADCAQLLGLATFMHAAGISCSQRLGDLITGLEQAGEAGAVRLLGAARQRADPVRHAARK